MAVGEGWRLRVDEDKKKCRDFSLMTGKTVYNNKAAG